MTSLRLTADVMFLAASLIGLNNGQVSVSVRVGILLMSKSDYPFDVRHFGPAIEIAVEKARSELGVNMTLFYNTYPGNCHLSLTIGHFVLLNSKGVDAFIGQACSESLMGVARLAEFYKIPMVTGVGDLLVRNPANNDMYQTLSMLSYSISKLSSKF